MADNLNNREFNNSHKYRAFAEKRYALQKSPKSKPTRQGNIKRKHIHIGQGTWDDILFQVIEEYGFNCSVHGAESDVSALYDSIQNACLAIVFEPADILNSSKEAYQVREALARGIDVIIVCRYEHSEFVRRFEDEDGVSLLKNTVISPEAFHSLFVYKLCKFYEAFDPDKCKKNEYGTLVCQAVDAWRGNAGAENYIAEQYTHGRLLPKLTNQAVFWYMRAMEHGSVRALVFLGDCYFYGNGCPENRKKAYELYCEAADQYSVDGMVKKGYCMLKGEGCEVDEEEAYKIFKHASESKHGSAEAEYYLGICLRDGIGAEANYSGSKAYFLKSAKGRFVPAFIELGNLFSSHSGNDYNPTLAYEYYNRAAVAGNIEGLYKKGTALCTGEGCEKNPTQAFECFKKGAESKDAACLCSLGMCYEFGIGCEYDFESAVASYSLASDKAYPAAINNLGGCFYYGHGVAQDRKKAMELFERASILGDSNATTRLGICYESGSDCVEDHKKAFECYLKASRQNNAIAAYKLALCYEEGIGTQQSDGRAFEAYEHAASLGHVESMYQAANCLSDGVGVKSDYWAAHKWYSKGAECGHAECFYEIANFSFKGVGTAKNYGKAFFCYNKAYELGSEQQDLPLRIGICLLRGLGTRENRVQALEWFKKAAQIGSADGMFLCGESYFYGSGCQKDYNEAVKYYALAANEDHTRAILSLAQCYEEGLGVPQSYKKALVLYRRAAEHDNPVGNYKVAVMISDNEDMLAVARQMLYKAANKGYVPAILELGIFYDRGMGIPENADKAAEKYLQAISIGIGKQKSLLFSLPERDEQHRNDITDATVDATYRLGMLKGRHSKTIEEYRQAFEYLAGAAATGSYSAQSEISRIYASGGDLHAYFNSKTEDTDEVSQSEIANAMNKLGDAWYDGKPLLEKNDQAAVKCYRIAANLGQADAAYSLGWCLRHGVGVKVDDFEAAKWLKRSADRGNPYAAYSYGLCCEEGSGMEHPNLREAISYYRKAAAAGHAEARKRHLSIVGKQK